MPRSLLLLLSLLLKTAAASAQVAGADTGSVQLLDSVSVRALRAGPDRDSLDRRVLYRRIISDRNERVRLQGGFPVLAVEGLFTRMAMVLSGKRKEQKRFVAQLEEDEAERFVARRCNAGLVQRVTPMDRDSAALFLRLHPVPVDFARGASELELCMWIRERYREWIGKN